MLVLGRSHRLGTKYRPVRQIDRPTDSLVAVIGELGLRAAREKAPAVADFQGDVRLPGDDRPRAAIDPGIGGAQGFVTAGDLVEAARQQVEPERPPDPVSPEGVEDGLIRIELAEDPDFLLRG